jgi:hypothetical protein
MGINIYSMSSHFRVQTERKADALTAVKALAGKETATNIHRLPPDLDKRI